MSKSKLAELVYAGMLKMQRYDENWFLELSATNFELISCTRCVLGQYFGEWDDGMRKLGLGFWNAYSYGFDLPESTFTEERYNLRVLNRMWRYVIRTLQTQHTALVAG